MSEVQHPNAISWQVVGPALVSVLVIILIALISWNLVSTVDIREGQSEIFSRLDDLEEDVSTIRELQNYGFDRLGHLLQVPNQKKRMFQDPRRSMGQPDAME